MAVITKKMPPKKGEFTLTRSTYIYGNTPYLGLWDDEEPYADVTINIPGEELGENEVILNHDLMGEVHKEIVDAILEYIAVPGSKREVIFGPFSTKTFAFTLVDGWEDMCYEENYGA